MAGLKYKMMMALGGLLQGAKYNKDGEMPLESVYDIAVASISGLPINLAAFRGKWLMVVNLASECGFTPQYAELQELYEAQADKVTILGCPSNDFGGQEPGTNGDIAQFCQRNFGVTFPLMEKSVVSGPQRTALYQWLSSPDKNGWCMQEPTWNFCKYLISPSGELKAYYPSGISPQHTQILKIIQL